MDKKVKVLAVLSSLSMLSYCVIDSYVSAIESSVYLSEVEDKFNIAQYSEEVSDDLILTLDNLKSFYSNNDVESLKKSIEIFSGIPIKMSDSDIELMKDGDIFDLIFYYIRDEIYKQSEIKDKEELIIYYGESLFLGWRIYKEVDIYGSKYLVKGLVEFNKDKNNKCQPRLDYLAFLYNYFQDNIDLDYDSGIIPDISINENLPPNKPSGPNYEYKPNEIPSDSSNKNEVISDNSVSNDRDGVFIDYKKYNNKCFEVTTTYKNGNKISSKKKLTSKENYVKCGIYDYIHPGLNIGSNIIIDKDYIEKDQNLESEYTVHYTINKTALNPYYFDTGIRTSITDNSISYNQLKDALFQLAIKDNGFSVTSNNKFLTVLEGKPILIHKSKDVYSKNEVERLLNSFDKVNFKIIKYSDNSKSSLEYSVNSGNLDSIIVNGEKLKLSSPAIISNDSLMLPADDIISFLGGKTYYDNNGYLIIEIGDKSFKIKENEAIYIENEVKKKFKSKPFMRDNLLYIEISGITSTIGYNIRWDSEMGELYFNQK